MVPAQGIPRWHRGSALALAEGIVRADFRPAAEGDGVRGLMARNDGVPMSLADGCPVRMTELEAESVVLTLDSDFGIIRRNRRQVIPP